jgi:hypothetical protein
MQTELTIEQQRRLTEFLGECWHEGIGLAVNHSNSEGEPTQLRYCGKYPQCRAAYVSPSRSDFERLDFSDWRVVGRLIEMVGSANISEQDHKLWHCFIGDEDWDCSQPHASGKNPQLAICLAIDAWLVGKEETK